MVYGNIIIMRIYAISDLHLAISTEKPMDIFGSGWTNHFERIKEDWEKVSDDDIVLVAGDISWAMTLKDALVDFAELSKLKGKKVLIRGNHDYWWQSIKKINDSLPSDIICLQNNAVKIGNAVICGSRGWNIAESGEDKRLIDREVIRFELSLTQAKKLMEDGDKLICMIHFPPFDIKTESDSPFTALFEKYNVDAVVYGHIHTNGFPHEKLVIKKNNITYYLTSCDILQHKLKEIEL